MEDLLNLRRLIVDELTVLLDPNQEDEVSILNLYELQPTQSVIREAAEAAASVFIAFERGYRMNKE